MKTRFFLMTALICLLLVAWVWLEQQYENARLEKYRQLSDLPVYIYVADSSRVAPLMERLAEFPQLRDINLETGLQAADELVQAYQLPISTGSLADYRFPSVITLLFKPLQASVEVKPAVMRAIAEQQIELTDIDAQSNAWGQTVKELAALRQRWLSYTIITAVMLGLLFFFIRLSYEFRFLLLQKRRLLSVADVLRVSTENHRHTWAMLVLPLLITVGGYFLLDLSGYARAIIPLWWFAIPAGTLFAATAVVFIVLNMYFHDRTFMPETRPDAAEEDSFA